MHLCLSCAPCASLLLVAMYVFPSICLRLPVSALTKFQVWFKGQGQYSNERTEQEPEDEKVMWIKHAGTAGGKLKEGIKNV